MKQARRKRLESAGWKVGSVQDFLDLSDQEAAFVEVKAALGAFLRRYRTKHGWSQTALAQRIGSSQSRVAKMEAGDRSVSLDLQVRALLAVGASPKELGKAFTATVARASA
jgi:ribosome-binding protein aMBF1 (putative translation factor)